MLGRLPRRSRAVQALLAALLFNSTPLFAAPEVIELRSGMAIDATGRPGRTTVFADALEARFSEGHWDPPQPGQTLLLADGSTKAWRTAEADAEGWFSGTETRGGSVWLSPVLASPATYVVEAQGHAMAYVNGEPRTGDPYGYGYTRLPVALKAGTNHIVLIGLRGRAKARLSAPEAPVFINTRDLTLPDLLTETAGDALGGAIVVNTTGKELRGWSLECQVEGQKARVAIPSVPALGMRKVPFPVHSAPRTESGEVSATLALVPPSAQSRDAASPAAFKLRVRRPEQTRKITFQSHIDGSVQYYALNPAKDLGPAALKPGLVLSLHGASVEAIGQADAYARKSGIHLVCPTNRRPYGFDWEEWGRMDALEVLGLAQSSLGTDPQRVYLTGHSMGGHGTWNLGVTFPERFAAIAPSAGWISFTTYVGVRSPKAGTNAMDQFLRRASASSETLGLATNYLSQSIYILHGDADDNVPVTEARTMRSHLGGFHPDVGYFEQPGAGHWWDGPLGGGADCVDWPPFFELFQNRRLPDPQDLSTPASLRFVTVNPGVSSTHHWVAVETQVHPLLPSEIHASKLDAATGIVGSTRNIERLRFALAPGEIARLKSVDLDGQVVPIIPGTKDRANSISLELKNGVWRQVGPAASSGKNPDRYGPFKEAFRHQMVFVYATRGTAEENQWAKAKARFDAEAFWYRGNGSVEVIPDTEFSPRKYARRGVVIYGHRDSNAAWASMLGDSPIQVRRGSVQVGDKTIPGEDLACVFLRPRSDDSKACVAVVSGSGPTGQRLTHRLPYFIAGTGFPDWMVLDRTLYTQGSGGVVGAGFFDNSWKLSQTESQWRP